MAETYKKISIAHKHFIQEMNTIWESFETIDHYSQVLHNLIKDETINPPSFQHLTFDKVHSIKSIRKDNSYGILSHIKDKKNPRTALIEAALIFEDYISKIILFVYTDHPMKASPSKDSNESNETREKLFQIILNSENKQEILDRLLEEKLRGMFYGNIADIFLKDKAKLELGDTFTNPGGRKLINNMSEIFARRNIHIHNGGRIDRKYIKEAKQHGDKLGKVLTIDSNYIRDSINILTQIATMFTCAVMKNIYNVSPKSSALKRTYWHK